MSSVIAAGLEAALNRFLRLDPDSTSRLMALEGKTIAIELEGLNQQFCLRFGSDHIQVMDHDDGTAIVRVRGAPLALLQQWRSPSLRDSSRITIAGDSTVAREFQLLLTRLDVDWEEQLAKRLGDPIAHQLGNIWRSFQDWGQRTSAVAAANSTEYLQYEVRALPPGHAVERFLSDVDILREDADRLAARIERLRQHLAPGRLG